MLGRESSSNRGEKHRHNQGNLKSGRGTVLETNGILLLVHR